MENYLFWYKATVIEIYDGDTFTLLVDHGFKIFSEHRIRLARVNTPEVRGKERIKGLIVRDFVRDFIQLGSVVFIHTDKDKKGSFNRYLAEVYFNEVNISDWLLLHGYAVLYVK